MAAVNAPKNPSSRLRLPLATAGGGDPEDLGIEDGARIWRARSFDPILHASLPEGSIAPGWYRATACIDARSGDLDGPRLYIPDAAGGLSEERSVQMRREGHAFVAEFRLEHAVPGIRFDPSCVPCEFACDALELEALEGPPPRRDAPVKPSLLQRLRRTLGTVAAAPGSPWQPRPARPPERKARVLAGIDREGVGLEIGPSHDPIAPKREGFKVDVIDHASREELLAKYEGHNVAHDQIEEVDFVWHGGTYLELTGRPKHYDWIIASHLIEHTPDLVGFLADCDAILKDGGVLSLVIPDKRYIFDRFRPVTALARVVDAHLAPRATHTPGAIAEHYLNAASKAHMLGWSRGTPGDHFFIHSAREAREKMEQARTQDTYHDIHNWCFVPHSFRLLVHDLYVLGLTRLREASFHPTEGCEFYVTLGRHGKGPALSRLELLREIDREISAEGP